MDSQATVLSMKTQLDQLTMQMAYLVERQKKSEEMWSELTPVMREVMGVATTRLDDLERRGYFAFGRELVALVDHVVRGFGPEDVRELGDAIVSILQTVRALTQPEVLAIAAQAGQAIEGAGKTEPLGLVGMVRATRDEEVQQGMAVLMDLMRHVGRAASVVRDKRRSSPGAERRAKLAAITGARKSKRVLGVERPAPASRPRRAAAPEVAASVAAAPQPAGCAVPRGPAPAVATIDGVAFSADGHMADPAAWTRAIAESIAGAQGVALGEAHWSLIEKARADYQATQVSPNIRRLTQIAGVATKDVYALFPKAPARTLAKIAGLPKPAGCL